MLTFLLCLLPILASIFGPTSAHYILDIHNNTLTNVRAIIHPLLNLSGMNLQALEENVFDHVHDLESLDLSNNSLTSLPEVVFSNLTKLKNISLANNQLWNLHNLFLGLNNLQLLDISRNPIRHLMEGSLYGLPKSTRILTNENNIEILSTNMFRHNLSENEELARITAQAKTVNRKKREMRIIDDTQFQGAVTDTDLLIQDTSLKLCKSDGIVTTLYVLWRIEELEKGCVPIDVWNSRIYLDVQNITGFQEGWYRLQILLIDSLDLSSNRIAEIKKETLNNLPEALTFVNFDNNQIRKIRSQMIENHHLRTLHISNNLVDEIEGNAFAKTRLHNLDLSGNQLNSLEFVSTLPDTMIRLILSDNRIRSIPNNTFSRLFNVSYLNLRRNKIEMLQNDVFHNLTSLEMLILEGNNITTIEPAAFKGLTALETLYLFNNYIRDLQESTFSALTALKSLDLSFNKIVKISFTDLPLTLISLHLDFNEISVLEKGSFVKVPRIALSLVGNNISSIARGAFNLSSLEELHLNENNLTTIDGDSYDGLGNLRVLLLSENQISEIPKGSCKNFNNLHRLDISSNPFQRLKAGAFYGFSTDAEGLLYILNNNLKEMQADLFDDV